MFAKLLKKEWRSSRKVIGLLCAIILISGVLIGASAFTMARWQQVFEGQEVIGAALGILVMLCVMAVGVSCAASIVYVLCRFYQSRFTQEGYLTYTLPVSNHELMLSSILMNTLEILLVLITAGVAVVLSMGIFALALPWNEVDPEAWAYLWRCAGETLGELGKHAGEVGAVLLFLLLLCLGELITLMLAVTVGGMAAKKHPILMSVVAYYGIGILKSIIGGLGLFTSFGSSNAWGYLGSLDCLNLLVILGGYFLMYWLTEKKLNLA